VHRLVCEQRSCRALRCLRVFDRCRGLRSRRIQPSELAARRARRVQPLSSQRDPPLTSCCPPAARLPSKSGRHGVRAARPQERESGPAGPGLRCRPGSRLSVQAGVGRSTRLVPWPTWRLDLPATPTNWWRRRWPIAAAAALVVGCGVAAAALLIAQGHHRSRQERNTARPFPGRHLDPPPPPRRRLRRSRRASWQRGTSTPS
jgi:hypothetical protein